MKIDQRLFPTILIILDVLAAIVWAGNSDWRKAVYWIAAAVLTLVITY